ncbi:MAG TPA: hypothetical protein VLA75_07605 [Thermoanaerobaculia bacterium]|nr:hypothetical protein [Thermoanaerobaculia bacterium]
MRAIRLAARAVRLVRAQGPFALARMALHQAHSAWGRLRPRHDFLRERPPTGDLVGMTTPEEQAFLYHHAKHDFRGGGAVVDLGCWLGSSTLPLAAGLAENRHPAAAGARVHAYDLFRWEEWMEDSLAGTADAGTIAPGASFLPLFERRLGAHRDRVEIVAGDLTELGWERGGPIAFLFNDAAKSWALANALLRSFYPALTPGSSLLVEQDFAHFFTPWVHLIHWRLREAFEPVVHVPFSGSMVFRVRRQVAHPTGSRDLGFADFGEEEIEAAFARSLALVEPPMRPNVWAARVMLEVHRGDRHRARALLQEAGRRGLRGLDLGKVRALLAG